MTYRRGVRPFGAARPTGAIARSMTMIRPEITGRAVGNIEPLALTVRHASELVGVGETTVWKWAKEGRIRLIRPPGTRRTLVDYQSLKNLLRPEHATAPAKRGRGRPRKLPTPERVACTSSEPFNERKRNHG
jgi:excisionase family DNA binding protein